MTPPARRRGAGRIVSFFSQGDGLAVAAALEDETYPLDELIYDLANLDAGFRFSGEDNRWAGRLAHGLPARPTATQTIPGYLRKRRAAQIRRGRRAGRGRRPQRPVEQARLGHGTAGAGDIDRIIIEWRSLLRQIAHAPDLDWPRWRAIAEPRARDS